MGAAIKGFVAKAGGMSGLLAGPWGIAIGIGASLILGKVAERKAKSAPSVSFGTELNLSGDPNDVGAICYGRAWTGGTLRYRNTTGVNNKDLYLVIVLAGHACEGVESVRADTDTLTLDGSGNVTSPAKWAGLMNVRFYLGSDSQTADSTLDSTFSDWTTNHRLCGRTYAIVKLTFDEENLRSVPNFRFLVKGRKVYDARLDSTNGGSGSHRLNTESTWAWSENALLCANDFHRGVMVNGIRVAGPGITRFSWPNVIAEANVCDENVALDAGGNENRYTTNGFIDPRQTHEELSEQFEQAFAGDFLFSDGAWRYFAGAYRAPSLSLTADHFVGPLRMVVHKSESDRRDTATGRYASLAAEGTQVNYAPFSLSTTTAGEERNQTIDFPLVNDATDAYPTTHDGGARAQRIAKLLLERDEAGKLITCTTNLYGWRAVPGESISVTHAAFGLSAQTMRVMDVQLRPFQDGDRTGLVVDLTLAAGPSSLYSWTAEETALDAPPTLAQTTPPQEFNWLGWSPDSDGKPSGFRAVQSIADRSQISLIDNRLRIDSAPDTLVLYGYAAVAVSELKDYVFAVVEQTSAASADGLYIRAYELHGALPAGKTHVGLGPADPLVEDYDSIQDFVADGPVFGTTALTRYFDYTPTAGTKFVTLAWGWDTPSAAATSYYLHRIALTEQGSTINMFRYSPVTTEDVNPGAIDTPQLADEAVDTPKLADDAVSTPKIEDAAATDLASDFEAGPISAAGFDSTDIVSVCSVTMTIADAACELEATASGRMKATHSASGGSLAYYIGLYYTVNGGSMTLLTQLTHSVITFNTWVPFGITGSIGGFSASDSVVMHLVTIAVESGGAEVATHDVMEGALSVAQVKR